MVNHIWDMGFAIGNRDLSTTDTDQNKGLFEKEACKYVNHHKGD